MKHSRSANWLIAEVTWKDTIFLSGMHATLCAIVLAVLQFIGVAEWGPDSLLQFDAVHYAEIANSGYQGFLQAFFPLFPLVWKALGTDALGISVFNAFVYLSALVWLARLLKPSRATFVIWLAIPSALFYFVPYTESFFFISSVVLLVGVTRRLPWVTCLGLLLCGLARPAFTVVVPALGLLSFLRHGITATAFKEILLWISTASASVVIVSFIQYQSTGEYIGFINAQAGWNNSLRLPELPFTSWGGAPSVRLDAVALLFGTLSLAWLVLMVAVRRQPNPSPALIVSLGYISSIAASVVAFRGGELFSLNRFVFATPFALVVLSSATQLRITVSRTPVWLLFISISGFFLIMGSFVHIQTFLAYCAIALHITWLISVPRLPSVLQPIGFWLWVLTTIGLQLFYFIRFMQGGWVA